MSLEERRRYSVGIVILFWVIVIWVGSSFLMNDIFVQQQYNKPFALAYINIATFSLYLLNFILKRKRPIDKQRILDFNHALYDTNSRSSIESIDEHSVKSDDDGMNEISSQPEDHYMYSTPQSSTFALGLHNESNSFFMRTHRPTGIRSRIDPHDLLSSVRDEEKLKTREVARLSFTFFVLWFAANWTTNASLAYTTVANSTILSSMSGLFTLIIGSLAGIERFTFFKFLTVVISIIGVFLVSIGGVSETPIENPHNPTDPLFGDILALIGAFFYGCYSVLLKLRIQNESRVNMPLFFGFVGLYNIFLLWPLFWLLHISGIEKFQLPPNRDVWIMVIVNALVGTFLSDYMWLLSVLMTSPLVVTLGLSLTIPLALFGDSVFKGIIMNSGYWFGALLVVGGFLGVNLATVKENRRERRLTSSLDDEGIDYIPVAL